jgi:thiosulfate/3-mercaptopyruvate sulfurtransferase
MFDTLVDAATLRSHLDDIEWVIIDCRHELADFEAGARAYAGGHIPGAHFANVETDLSGKKTGTNGRHPLPNPQAFLAFLNTMGTNESTQIVAYDAGADMFAARLWYLARWIGHEFVAILDGGFGAWTSAAYPVTSVVPAHEPGTLRLRPARDRAYDRFAVRERIGSSEHVLLDARAANRYAGEVEPIDPVAGHIPGARNRPFKENFDESGRWKSPQRLRAEFSQFDDPALVINYCGSGVSAAANLFSMHVAGLRGAGIYPGSWSEWCADPENPVER